MSEESCLVVRKPVSTLNRPLKFNFMKLFKIGGKISVDFTVANYHGIIKELCELPEVIGLGRDPGQIAWLLIVRSLGSAMAVLVEQNSRFLRTELTFSKELESAVQEKLESVQVTIDSSFFRRPGNLAIISDFKDIFSQWLQDNGATFDQARSASNGLPAYFSQELEKEWQAHRDAYAPLLEFFAPTPFGEAQKRESAWLQYALHLQRQVQAPMLGEPFSIEDVFVPLRAYYEYPDQDNSENISEEGERPPSYPDRNKRGVVVKATEHLLSWFQGSSTGDVRLLSGGPGSGKSTVARIIAAELAAAGERVLYVPLHELRLEGGLIEAVGEWASWFLPFIDGNPLDFKESDPRLLVIFDGLDELAMTGKIAQELAKRLTDDLD